LHFPEILKIAKTSSGPFWVVWASHWVWKCNFWVAGSVRLAFEEKTKKSVLGMILFYFFVMFRAVNFTNNRKSLKIMIFEMLVTLKKVTSGSSIKHAIFT
jgi:hypothetical protein